MATGSSEQKTARRSTALAPQALVLVSRSAAPIEEFEADVATITRLGKAIADARGRARHPMKMGQPTARWWTRRQGTWAWQLTLPLPSHVTARDVHDAVEASRSVHAARVQLQLLHPEEARPAPHRLASTMREMREVRVGATPQHRGREVR
jgi:hypothetical protein